jgi:DNA-binding transcriptional ArsR family regulator
MGGDAAEPAGSGSPATSTGEGLRSSDPAVLRALAHPLRVEILEILDDAESGEVTASEIAERTGQTVANCSFHLRTLERAGFIERGAQRGREKPWRTPHRSRDLRPDPNDAESVRAAGAVGALYVQREAARLLEVLTAPQPFGHPEWNDAVTVSLSRFWATPEEMRELGAALGRLTDAFAGRSDDPTLRPPGARPGRLFAAANPDPWSS